MTLVVSKLKRNNALYLVRLLATFEVMYGHAVAHLDLSMPREISTVIHFFYGVPIFFTMSGFLIWGSIERSKNYGEYLQNDFGEYIQNYGWQ